MLYGSITSVIVSVYYRKLLKLLQNIISGVLFLGEHTLCYVYPIVIISFFKSFFLHNIVSHFLIMLSY